MPKVKSWGLSDSSEPDELEAFEPYDGPDPKKGVYKFRLTNFRIKCNKNDDPMLNGLLIIQEDRVEKKKFNGWPVWFNQNITDQGKPYILQILKALGVTWSDFHDNTIVEGKMPEENGDDPAPIAKIGKVKFGEDTLVRASIGARKDNSEEMEVKTFLPWKDDDELDSDDESDESEEDEEGTEDADEAEEVESDEWTREELEDFDIDGLKEILDGAEVEYDEDRPDEEYFIALILDEEPPDPPAAKKTAAKKGAAKKTAKKAAKKGGAPF